MGGAPNLARRSGGEPPVLSLGAVKKLVCPVLSQMKQSWVEIGIPIKERDDILRVMSKVQDKFGKVRKNAA